tara:strand:- start:268 stop:789 length:522 start_codon:yes stop_codon:yes gene_type:complete
MKKNHLLSEELSRMRQLMGMNGSLYQKPIMEDKSKSPGHGSEPNPKTYKGGAKDPQYKLDYDHWRAEHKAPAPKAPKAPKFFAPASEAKPKTGTGSSSVLDHGEFVLPMGAIPGMSGPSKGGPSKGGKGKSSRRSKTKRTRRKTTRGKAKTTRGKAKTSRAKKTNRKTKKKED